MDDNNKTQKRMIFNIGETLHHQVKSRASYRNISMRDWIVNAILRAMKEEDKYR